MPTPKKTDPHINFSGIVTIMITLITMIFTYDTTSQTINWGTTLFFITLYFILALSTGGFDKSILNGMKGRIDNMKKFCVKIYKGRISPVQAFWIFAYISYRILISSNFFNIPMPFVMIVTIGFVIALSLTNKRIRTITEVVKDVFIMKPLDKLMEKMEEPKKEEIKTKLVHKITIKKASKEDERI